MRYNYNFKSSIPDAGVFDALQKIRWILDSLRNLGGPADDREYRNTYDEAQACYQATLEQARERNLSIPPWEGDDWFLTDTGWEKI